VKKRKKGRKWLGDDRLMIIIGIICNGKGGGGLDEYYIYSILMVYDKMV